MRFVKFHGYGNDYIVCEASELAGVSSSNGEFVRRICERHYGAGADGVAVVERLAEGGVANFSLRIINPDGSEAAMSGNGSRCAAAYLHYRELWSAEELSFQTRAGVKRYWLREKLARRGGYRFEAEIGRPRFDSDSIPMKTGEPLTEVRNYALSLGEGEAVEVTAMEMCNPNCCVFVDDFEEIDWRRLGALIERHEAFPQRTNVIFVRVRDRRTVEARVWERGAGETLSSGTGASAAAVASIINDRTDRQVSVEMPGGRLEVLWREDGEVLLSGTAEVVYAGEWLGEQ